MPRYLSLASQTEAGEAAQLALSGQGNALFAAMSGFFAAAGVHPGVLFSPVSLLVGGLGSGTFAYDGRARQPGRQAKRPRGFEGDAPGAARVAVPASLSALAVACAFHPGTSMLAASRTGVSLAKARGARSRATLIDAAAGLGARFLTEPRLKSELLSRFGPAEQGNWGPADLLAPEGLQRAPVETFASAGDSLTLPWRQPTDDETQLLENHAWGRPHCVVAVDAAGLFVALAYRELPELAVLNDFEVYFPAFAVPVLRGVPRVTPGEPLPTPAELYLDRDETGAVCAVRGIHRENGQPLRIVRDAATKEAFSG